MNLPELRRRARTFCRQGLGAALRRIPDPAFRPLRESFPRTSPDSVQHRLQRRLLEVARHRGVPASTRSFPLVDNPEISLVNADSFVVERLYWFGEKYGYEPDGLRWWRYFCGRSSHILELGANVGYYSVQGARAAPSARYVAVEPHPGCAEVCRDNLRVNGISNVELVEAAAVADAGVTSVTLRMPGALSHDHYVQAPCTAFVGRNELHKNDADDPTYTTFDVRAVEFRSLMAGVDLLKMDVEGQEHVLLSSIEADLAAARPTMFVELLDDTPNLRTLIARLCGATDYTCFVATPDGLAGLAPGQIESVSLPTRFGTRDLILTCQEVPAGRPPGLPAAAGSV